MEFLFPEQKIKSLIKSVGRKKGKHVLWIFRDPKGKYALGVVVFNNVLPSAEVHQKSVDMWYVLKGKGIFIIGGKLKNGFKKKPNEWVAPAIAGGKRLKIKPGDAIEIPAGIPHQTDARNKNLAMLIVKINS